MNNQSLSRRTFLQSGSMAVTAAAMTLPAWAGEAEKPKILNQQEGMAYRQLGTGDLYLSVISLGGLAMDSSGGVFHYAIEKGVNLIHCCLSYMGGRSIEMTGKTMKTDRDKVYLALKDDFSRGSLESALKILNTDHVDFIMFNRHSPASASDTKILEQFEKWKKEGKVRFAGLTSHNEVKTTTAAGINSGMFSIVMPVLNQNALRDMEEEMKLAKQKNVGVMAMKSMQGIRGLELETAYVKKALSNPALTTVNKGFDSFEKFDAYAKAAKETLTSMEDRALYKYANAARNSTCMMCGECTQVCPQGIAVSTLLRSSDYYYEQCGDQEWARITYAEVPREHRPDFCSDCGNCEQVCPNGIAVREHLKRCYTRLGAVA